MKVILILQNFNMGLFTTLRSIGDILLEVALFWWMVSHGSQHCADFLNH
jgi:hypothetical protein